MPKHNGYLCECMVRGVVICVCQMIVLMKLIKLAASCRGH